MKSCNKIYALLLIVIIGGFAFFLSTKSWLPDDRTKQNNNYDELLNVGDWSLHVGSAEYNDKTMTFKAVVYQRSEQDSPKPYSITVFSGSPDNKKQLAGSISQRKNDPNYVTLTVKNVPRDFYYLTLVIKTSGSEYDYDSDSSDDGYFDSKASSSSENEIVKYVKIDYRTVSSASGESR